MTGSEPLPAEPAPRHRGDPEYNRLWRVVDGALRETLRAHPEYAALLHGSRYAFRVSATKRIVGALLEEVRAGRSARVGRGEV